MKNIKQLTRDSKETIKERIQDNPDFVIALLNEVIFLSLNEELDVAILILKDLISVIPNIYGEAKKNEIH